MQKKIEDFTTDELKEKKKTLQLLTSLLGIVLFIIFSIGIYRTFNEGEIDPIIAVPLALMSILLLNYKKLKEINAELNARKIGTDG